MKGSQMAAIPVEHPLLRFLRPHFRSKGGTVQWDRPVDEMNWTGMALWKLAASPSLAAQYVGRGRSYEASADGTRIRRAIFMLAACEYTYARILRQRHRRTALGLDLLDYSDRMHSLWKDVTDEETNALFEEADGELPLTDFQTMRFAARRNGPTARSEKLTHSDLQLAVALAALRKSTDMLIDSLDEVILESICKGQAGKNMSDQGDLPPAAQRPECQVASDHTKKLQAALGRSVTQFKRAQSILRAVGIDASSWEVAAALTYCHLRCQRLQFFDVDAASSDAACIDGLWGVEDWHPGTAAPLRFVELPRLRRSEDRKIAHAVHLAEARHRNAKSGGCQSALSRAAATDHAQTPIAVTQKSTSSPLTDRGISSCLRASLGPIMKAMQQKGLKCGMRDVADLLGGCRTFPAVYVRGVSVSTSLEGFDVLGPEADPRRQHFRVRVRGQSTDIKYGAMAKAVHDTRLRITNSEAQPR